jgi:hypothetical protein
MMERLKARKAEIARLREERGATDPILIIAGIAITLILLVGGSFAISGFISNAHNLNAKGDLDRIATAQAAYMVQNDGYGTMSYGPNVGTQDTELQDAAIGFTPSEGTNTIVRSSGAGWVAVTKSASGAVYARSSEGGDIFEISGFNGSSSYGAWAESRRNLLPNPNAAPGGLTYYVQNPGGYSSNVVFEAGAGPNGENAGSLRVASSDGSSQAFRTRLGGNGGTVLTLPATTSQTVTFGMDIWLPAQLAGTTMRVELPINGANGTTYQNNFTFTGESGWQRVERTVTLTPRQTLTDFNQLHVPQLVTVGARFAAGDDIARVTNLSYELGENASFFSGSSTTSDPSVQYAWVGPADNSASVMRTRPATGGSAWYAGNQPSGFVLPSGITWAQVAEDLQEIYS